MSLEFLDDRLSFVRLFRKDDRLQAKRLNEPSHLFSQFYCMSMNDENTFVGGKLFDLNRCCCLPSLAPSEKWSFYEVPSLILALTKDLTLPRPRDLNVLLTPEARPFLKVSIAIFKVPAYYGGRLIRVTNLEVTDVLLHRR